jgi:hypothetical protein
MILEVQPKKFSKIRLPNGAAAQKQNFRMFNLMGKMQYRACVISQLDLSIKNYINLMLVPSMFHIRSGVALHEV